MDIYDPLRKAQRTEKHEKPKAEAEKNDAANNDRSRERSLLNKPRAKLKSKVVNKVNQRERASCQAKFADSATCAKALAALSC